MAIAAIHETLLTYTWRKSTLAREISELQSYKTLALMEQGDVNAMFNAKKSDIKDFYKHLYNTDDTYAQYKDYTEIPDFKDAMDRIDAEMQDELDRIAAWEREIDAQITTKDTELQEINAYTESMKTMRSSNIQEDFNFGLGGGG